MLLTSFHSESETIYLKNKITTNDKTNEKSKRKSSTKTTFENKTDKTCKIINKHLLFYPIFYTYPLLHSTILARKYNKKENIEEAIGYYQKAIQLNPKILNTYIELAKEIYISHKMLDEALDILNKAIELNGKNPDTKNLAIIHTLLGKLYIESIIKEEEKILSYLTKEQKFQKASLHLQKAIEIDKNSLFPYVGLGIVQALEGNVTEAINYYEKSIKLHPNYYVAYIELGDIYLKEQKDIKALEIFKKAMDIIKNKPDEIIDLNLQKWLNNNIQKLQNRTVE